jgi:hypothetical protein
MDRAQLIRRIRIAASVFFALVTVALIVLWARSYKRIDIVYGRNAASEFAIGSTHGLLVPMGTPDLRSIFQIAKFTEWGSDNRLHFPSPSDAKGRWGISLHRFHAATILLVPIWIPFLLAMLLFGVCWPYWSRQFSFRALLVATTLVAVVLGLMMWASR